jgi:hypothetical protein
MTIDAHEWPLPSDNSEANAIVFELDCPDVIRIWRDLTFYVLVNVLSPTSSEVATENKKYYLHSYDGLRPYYTSKAPRLEPASTAKPIVASHYRSVKVSVATESNVLFSHALRYDVYDTETDVVADAFLGRCNIRESCSQKLPHGPYQCLQYSVSDTIHFPNQVIADQSTCPAELSIHEFLAFGHVRAGHRLQWQNVAVSIVDGNLNLNQDATRILLTQAAWEAGPSFTDLGNVFREAHAVLEDSSFCHDILKSLRNAITATEENWQGTTSIQSFIALALRILSLSPHLKVREQCLSLLAVARDVTVCWLRKLADKLESCDKDDLRESWTNSALEIALTCSSTFDMDLTDTVQVLQTGDNLAVFTECAITMHDLCPASTVDLPSTIQEALLRFSRLTHTLENTLHSILITDPRGLNHSVARLWTSYQPGTPWRSVESEKREWLVTESANGPACVHYNLLTGSLLVNGAPLSRLPRPYEIHDSYQRLFGAVSKPSSSVEPDAYCTTRKRSTSYH